MMSTSAATIDQEKHDVLRSHLLLAGLIAIYVAIATTLSRNFDLPVETGKVGVIALHFAKMVPQMVFLVLFWRLLHLSYVEKASDRIGALRADIRGFFSDRDRMTGGLIASALMVLVLMSFAQLKSLIPMIQPFAWDVDFAELDRVLHFGTDPYRIVHAVLGWNLSISFFTGMYNIWLFMAYFTLFGTCFMHPKRPARLQFLIAFLLVWAVGGNLLATVFSSAGPVYYAKLGLGDTFAPLFDTLQAHAATGMISVIETQDLLWRFYTASNSINAISAFPSMHVASTTLMALLGFQIARWIGISLTIFAAIIMVGSVLLGWHYAVDGYVGALLAVVGWKLSGWLIRSPIGPFRGQAA
jgi:membrane-associated phospholipid phosphatase